MHVGTAQVRFLGIIAIGMTCSIIACGRSGAATRSSNEAPAGVGSTTLPTLAPTNLILSPGAATLAPSGTLSVTAQLSGAAATDIVWSVDGVTNGNATVGKITGRGVSVLYSAPAADGSHTIAAITGTGRASDSARVMVLSSCAPAPASSIVANVKDPLFGAQGDGSLDETAAIQKAINFVAGTGGTVIIPDGTYMVNAVSRNGRNGLTLGSNMTLRLSSGAILKAIPNAAQTSNILVVSAVSNVNIIGGILEGDRVHHLGSTGEWGAGIQISNSKHVVVEGVTARECWGDGFYVTNTSSDITFCKVIADHNRRQGLTIVSADGVIVKGSTFKNTIGAAPEFGIDVEPNRGETVTNLQISDCTIANNNGGGIAGGPPISQSSSAFFTKSRIAHNMITGNKGYGFLISACSGVTFENNTIRTTAGYGILLRNKALKMNISGNKVSGSTLDGIYLDDCAGTLVANNTVSGNGGLGIHQIRGCGATVSGNSVSANGKKP